MNRNNSSDLLEQDKVNEIIKKSLPMIACPTMTPKEAYQKGFEDAIMLIMEIWGI